MPTITFTCCKKEALRVAGRSAMGLLVFAAAVALAHCGTACNPVSSPANDYATEIIACAATAGYPGAYSRDSDMRCRAEVDKRWGVGQYRDAGSDQ